MNDVTDSDWFVPEGSHPFGKEEHIKFAEKKKWEEYVDSRQLEITCGEAPYLVSRYDVSSGESIPVPERTGMIL